MVDKEDDNRIIPEYPSLQKPEDSRFEQSAMLQSEDTSIIELPKRADSSVANAPSLVSKQYVSEHMDMLTRAITEDNS